MSKPTFAQSTELAGHMYQNMSAKSQESRKISPFGVSTCGGKMYQYIYIYIKYKGIIYISN